jgi:hypothetical protein
LVKLLGQGWDTVGMLDNVALSKKAERSAIDLFKIDLNLAPWCLYLLHPGQAVGGLFYWKNFLRVLFHRAISFPQLERDTGDIGFKIWSKVWRSFLAESIL